MERSREFSLVLGGFSVKKYVKISSLQFCATQLYAKKNGQIFSALAISEKLKMASKMAIAITSINDMLLLLTFKCLNWKAPRYLCDLLQTYQPTSYLRSESQNLPTEKSSKSKTYGDRAFSIATPRRWNNMPMDLQDISSIETFKKKLKTYLFKEAYDL